MAPKDPVYTEKHAAPQTADCTGLECDCWEAPSGKNTWAGRFGWKLIDARQV